MNVEQNEILYLYNSEKAQEKEGLVYAESLKNHTVKSINLQEQKVTQTQLTSLADKLGVEISGLVDDNADAPSTDAHDLLDFLVANPLAMKTPIVVYATDAIFVGSQYELISKHANNSTEDVQTSKTQQQS